MLTEIWVSETELSLFALDQYVYFTNCNESYRSGGVIVYVLKAFRVSCSRATLTSADAIKITVCLNITNICRPLSVIVVYRLHSFPVRVFMDQINNCLTDNRDRNLLLVVDMNLCVFEQTQLVDDYQIAMISHGLEQLIKSPTRGY